MLLPNLSATSKTKVSYKAARDFLRYVFYFLTFQSGKNWGEVTTFLSLFTYCQILFRYRTHPAWNMVEIC